MNQRFHEFIYQDKYSGLILFTGVLVILTLWFTGLGAFGVGSLPGFGTRLQLIGQVLMLILLPSYFAMGMVFAQRRSFQLAREIQSRTDFDFADHIGLVPRRNLFIGGVMGLVFSLFNLPGSVGQVISSDNSVVYAIALGQILVWSTLGLVLTTRFHVARAFYEAGKRVKVDIFELSSLKPFAQAGLTDALLTVVGLAITALQSLDAQVRMDNYINVFLVVLPAIGVLVVAPMYSLRRRIVKVKREELQQINERILAAAKDLNADHVDQLELMLQRRERVMALPNWPIDMSIISRLLLYVIVPPLAWIGAAFVEIVLNSFLSGA